MLFKVTDKPVREDNPELESVPEFKDVPDRVLKFIFLVYDYKSAYRMISIEKRKEKCAIIAGFKLEPDGKRLDKNARDVVSGSFPKMRDMVAKFIELMGDDEMELLMSYDEMIEGFKMLMRKKDKDDKEQALALKIAKELPDIVKKRRELAELVESRGMVISDKDNSSFDEDRNISTIDEINSNDQD